MAEIPTRIYPIDFDNNVAVGIKLPMAGTVNSFFALNYTTFDQLKTNFRNLLLTEKGERYMLPTYGMGLKRFLFETNQGSTWSAIDSHIRTTTSKWMPQINILDIEIGQDDRNANMITLNVKFQSKLDSSQIDTLTIDFMTSQ